MCYTCKQKCGGEDRGLRAVLQEAESRLQLWLRRGVWGAALTEFLSWFTYMHQWSAGACFTKFYVRIVTQCSFPIAYAIIDRNTCSINGPHLQTCTEIGVRVRSLPHSDQYLSVWAWVQELNLLSLGRAHSRNANLESEWTGTPA